MRGAKSITSDAAAQLKMAGVYVAEWNTITATSSNPYKILPPTRSRLVNYPQACPEALLLLSQQNLLHPLLVHPTAYRPPRIENLRSQIQQSQPSVEDWCADATCPTTCLTNEPTYYAMRGYNPLILSSEGIRLSQYTAAWPPESLHLSQFRCQVHPNFAINRYARLLTCHQTDSEDPPIWGSVM